MSPTPSNAALTPTPNELSMASAYIRGSATCSRMSAALFAASRGSWLRSASIASSNCCVTWFHSVGTGSDGSQPLDGQRRRIDAGPDRPPTGGQRVLRERRDEVRRPARAQMAHPEGSGRRGRRLEHGVNCVRHEGGALPARVRGRWAHKPRMGACLLRRLHGEGARSGVAHPRGFARDGVLRPFSRLRSSPAARTGAAGATIEVVLRAADDDAVVFLDGSAPNVVVEPRNARIE